MPRPALLTAAAALLASLILLASCDSSPSEPVPAPIGEIRVMAGPEATALVEDQVELEIRILWKNGSPAAEMDGSWEVHGAGALIDPAPAVTDREGRARATSRLGPTAGKERRRIAVEGLATWLESTTVPEVPEHLTWDAQPPGSLTAGDPLVASVQVLNLLERPIVGVLSGLATVRGPLGAEGEGEVLAGGSTLEGILSH